MARRIIAPRSTLQVGKQATLGTPVVTGTELFGSGISFNYQKVDYDATELDGGGNLAASNVASERMANNYSIARNMPVDFNSLLLEYISIFGEPTGQPTNLTPPASGSTSYQWLFERSPNLSEPIVTYTMRCVERDSEATPNTYVVQAQDAFVETMTIQSNEGAPPTVNTQWRANRPVHAATYAAGTKVTPSLMPSLPIKVSIDDTWAAMTGSSPTMVADVMSVNAVLTTNHSPAAQLDGSTHLGYNVLDPGKMMLDATIGIWVSTDAAGLYREEFAHAEAQDGRFVSIRFEDTGNTIDATGMAVRTWEIGGHMKHMQSSLSERGQLDAGGRMQMNLVFQSWYDETSEHDIYGKIINTQSAWPA